VKNTSFGFVVAFPPATGAAAVAMHSVSPRDRVR
jgi:hypothetical protein